MHLLDATQHKPYSLLQRQPETAHTRIGNRDRPPLPLLHKYRDDAAAAAHYVSVARATEARVLPSGVRVCLHKHLLGAELGRAVEINRIDSLIRTQRQNAAHSL